MDLLDKLQILGESARYDVSCSTSGVSRPGDGKGTGNALPGGICHTWTEDGRCVSLLKILQSNHCDYDCAYCANRRSNDFPRTALSPEELADLTIAFYRRNYIEGLFLSSGVVNGPDHTTELMLRTLRLLRHAHGFNGYIHAKAIPGTSAALLEQLGTLADRVSVNLEQCTRAALASLAPQKCPQDIASPMRYLAQRNRQSLEDRQSSRRAPAFMPAGQSTQLIVGASAERDWQILASAQHLYRGFGLRRVYYSAYLPINSDARLPSRHRAPPLLREHRLYQADWLLRFYRFQVDELLSPAAPDLDLDLDPKSAWALRHLDRFPVELNTADYELLLRVPGIGAVSAERIVAARRSRQLRLEDLPRLRVSRRRAGWFITCGGRYGAAYVPDAAQLRALLADPVGRERQPGKQMRLEELDLVCTA